MYYYLLQQVFNPGPPTNPTLRTIPEREPCVCVSKIGKYRQFLEDPFLKISDLEAAFDLKKKTILWMSGDPITLWTPWVESSMSNIF